MLHVLLVSALAAQTPIQLASVGFSAVKVPRALVVTLEETFAHRLSQGSAVRVTTQKDVATVLGVERQKQLLGCADDTSSCLAELAGALGSEGLIRGEVTQFGRVLQVSVRIIDPKGAVLFSGLRRVKGDEAMLVAIDELANDALAALVPRLRPPTPVVVVAKEPVAVAHPSEPAPPPSPRVGPWVLAGVGGVLLVGGAIAQGLAVADYTLLGDRTKPVADPIGLRERGKLTQVVGLSLLAAGGIAATVGVLWALLGAPATNAGLWLSPDGAGLALGGVWP